MRIDCNITENYLKEGLRAYKQDGQTIGNINSDATPESIKKSVEMVQKWSDRYPPKTYLEDLLEKYPNTELNIRGVPKFCPNLIGLEDIAKSNCIERCVECWNQFI